MQFKPDLIIAYNGSLLNVIFSRFARAYITIFQHIMKTPAVEIHLKTGCEVSSLNRYSIILLFKTDSVNRANAVVG